MTCSRNSLRPPLPAPTSDGGGRWSIAVCLVLGCGPSPRGTPEASEQLALPPSPAPCDGRGHPGQTDGAVPRAAVGVKEPTQITKSSWSTGLKAAALRMSREFTRIRVPVRCFQRLVMGFFILSRPMWSSWMTSR